METQLREVETALCLVKPCLSNEVSIKEITMRAINEIKAKASIPGLSGELHFGVVEKELDLLSVAWNPSTTEAEAGRSLQV